MSFKHDFLKGTLILMIANAISKILGAIFKIPLTYILNEEGMAIFSTAMNVYATVLSFVVSGFPLAISRLISSEYALGNQKNIKKTVNISILMLSLLGFFGSLILYFGSDFFALAMKDPKAGLAIKVISPSVLFVAVGAVYKSYFQGSVNMIPTAISQVIESFIRLIIGFLAAYILKNAVIEVTSAGAISGITIGEIIATLILFLLFIPSERKLKKTGDEKSTKMILKLIIDIAFPMFICSMISCGINLIDTASIRNSLLNIRFTQENVNSFLLRYSSFTSLFDNLNKTLEMSIDGARWLYGAYSGYALTIFHLPTGIISALSTSIFPVISGAFAKNDKQLANKTILSAISITTMIILPCALILFLFSEDILYVLFKNTASAHILSVLAPSLLFLCLSDIFTVTLHAMGKVFEPFIYTLIGMVIKLIANFALIPIASLNIDGAIIGSTIAFIVMLILNLRALKKYTGLKLYPINTFIKPIASSIVMCVIMILLYEPLLVIFSNELISLIITVLVGATGYLLSLISLNCIKIPSRQ